MLTTHRWCGHSTGVFIFKVNVNTILAKVFTGNMNTLWLSIKATASTANRSGLTQTQEGFIKSDIFQHEHSLRSSETVFEKVFVIEFTKGFVIAFEGDKN